jgi:predicted nucleic acid-binding protein
MNIILDSSAAIELALNREKSKQIEDLILEAEWVMAPDLFISEVTNVLWKYHNFGQVPIVLCEAALENAIQFIDNFSETKDLYKEAFAMSCLTKHSAYDAMYLILARRNNAFLLTMDKKLKATAQQQSIKVADI